MLRKVVLYLFSFIWLFIIFAEYLFQHSWYAKAVENFQYYGFLIPLILLIGGVGFYLHRNKEQRTFKGFNGLSLFVFSFLISLLITVIFFSKYEGVSMTSFGAINLAGIYFLGGLSLFLCVGLCYVLGDLLLILFPLQMRPNELFLIKIAFGMVLVVCLLFLLGTVNLLFPILLIPLFVGLILLNLKGGKTFVETTLWKPISLAKDLNVIGLAAFAFLLSFITMNFTSVLRPIPIGFDAMTLYMRLPSLIGDYQGLVAGNGLYNYSLFMSLGYVVFDSTMVTLCLSFVGGPLALFALYALCRRWMNANLALVVLACFYVMPEMSYLSFQDMKVDLGLLFISLCSIILLVNWVSPYETPLAVPEETSAQQNKVSAKTAKSKSKSKKTPARKKKATKKSAKSPTWMNTPSFILKFRDWISANSPALLKENSYMIALGILIGFAFGIKLTSIMLFMGVLIVIWYVKGNAWTTLGITLLCFFGVLLLGFDKQSGLRNLHAYVAVTQWGAAIIGLAIITWQALKKKQLIITNVKRSFIIGGFFILMLLPWFTKNLIETREFNSEALLQGQGGMTNMEFPAPKTVIQYEELNP